jgi:hypothetical protein
VVVPDFTKAAKIGDQAHRYELKGFKKSATFIFFILIIVNLEVTYHGR